MRVVRCLRVPQATSFWRRRGTGPGCEHGSGLQKVVPPARVAPLHARTARIQRSRPIVVGSTRYVRATSASPAGKRLSASGALVAVELRHRSVASHQTCWAKRLNSSGAQWQAEITAERPRATSMSFATQSPQRTNPLPRERAAREEEGWARTEEQLRR